MGNRLACLLAVPLMLISAFSFAQSTTSAYPAGQDNCFGDAAMNNPNCQQVYQQSNRDTRIGGNDPTTPGNAMPSMQQNDGFYVDSAGQIRQAIPRQNNQGNVYSGYESQQPPDQPTDFQRVVSLTTGQYIPIYGRQLFRGVPSTFAPIDQSPVTPDYVIGPGDELLIRVWGPVVFNDRLTVDRSGSIYVPKVGSIHVAGIPYSELDKHLRQELGRVFRNFDLNVNMGQLRSIRVFVLGQAKRPGSYTLSSLSTLINALFASGGPSAQGTMRSIQLKRDGKTISDLDLYALLNKGDKSEDIKLLPGDIIFIPPVGPQVAMTGAVKVPGIYELKGESTLEEVIALAGGLSSMASDTRVALERIEEHNVRQAMQIAFDAAGKSTPLRDGDVVRVFSITPRFEKTVTVRGNLANPGRFAWHAGMRISEVIPDRESLLTNNYWRNHNKLGIPARMFFEPLPGTQQTPLGGKQASDASSPPAAGTSPPAAATPPANTSDPSQADSGTGPLSNPEESLPSQPSDSTSPTSALGAQHEGSRGSLASQQSRIMTLNATAPSEKVTVRVAAPEIDWSYAVIERLDPVTLRNSLLPFNLGSLILDHDATQDLELQASDVVTIFSQGDIRVPLNQQTKFIKLEGEIVSAGTYSAHKGETLRQLVARAGGLAPNAYLFGSEFTRESTRVLQQQRLDEYVDSLAIDLQRQGSNNLASGQDPAATASLLTAEKDMIARLRQVRATGRIVMEISPNAASLETIPNIPLEDGDAFVVPAVPGSVNVVGAVYDQNSFLFGSTRRVEDYLHLAGGPNRNADKKHAFLIRADGSVFSKETANSYWGNTFARAQVNPGDTIVLPEKLSKASPLRGLIQWSQVFSQLALGAASIIVLSQ